MSCPLFVSSLRREFFWVPISMKFPKHRRSSINRLNTAFAAMLCVLRHVQKRTWFCCSQRLPLLPVGNHFRPTLITEGQQGPVPHLATCLTVARTWVDPIRTEGWPRRKQDAEHRPETKNRSCFCGVLSGSRLASHWLGGCVQATSPREPEDLL